MSRSTAASCCVVSKDVPSSGVARVKKAPALFLSSSTR